MNLKQSLSLLIALFFTTTIFAAIPNTDNPKSFGGPTLKASMSQPVNDLFAYGLLGEAGLNNFRVGGTLGFALMPRQRIKVSAEYLRQRINYAFFSGNTKQWVNQGALGIGYQYDIGPINFDPQFNLNAFYSHAPSKSLSTVTGTCFNCATVADFTNVRRIAGSNAAGIAPGVVLHPWIGSEVEVDVNYDHVNYDQKYSRSQDAKGFGGSVFVRQLLPRGFGFDLGAAVRKPFNNYQAGVSWSGLAPTGIFNLGISGAYVVGKNTLPNTYNIFLNGQYAFDRPALTSGHARQQARDFVTGTRAELSRFVATPAVYVPQVLAIPDERVTFAPAPVPACAAGVPTVVGILPDLLSVTALTTVATAGVFTGSGLTFAVDVAPDPAPSTVTIDPATGVVTIDPVAGGEDVTVAITVTATNTCGSASTTFEAIIPED